MKTFLDIDGYTPSYSTSKGHAYQAEALDLIQAIPEDSVNLVITSPPFALVSKKEYGNKEQNEYVEWLCGYAAEILRVLTDDGSFVIDIGGAWNKGIPTRSLYQYRLILALCDQVGFHLAQDFYWYNPAAIPGPAEWVNVRRIRVKPAVNLVWWLSKSPWPKANNKNVLKPYSKDMKRLIEKGVRETTRPSGHVIKDHWRDQGGAIPPNMLDLGNNDANSAYIQACRAANLPIHPARFPRRLPEFFIELCTEKDDLVLDPFAGSNVAGEVAEELGRRWISCELREDYVAASKLRFLNQFANGDTPSLEDLSDALQCCHEPITETKIDNPEELLMEHRSIETGITF